MDAKTMDLSSLSFTPRYTQLSAKAGGASTAADSSESGHWIVLATILFTIAVFAFESYLSLRQRSSYRRTSFPEELKTTVGSIDAERARELKEKKDKGEEEDAPAENEEKAADDKKKEGDGEGEKKDKVDRNAPLLPQLQSKFDASQAYGLDKVNFSLFSSAYGIVEEMTFLLLGFMPYIWDASCAFGEKYLGKTEAENEIVISLVFLA